MAVDDYNRRAISALQRAQELSHARSSNAFARLLSERASGSPSASTYRRWISGEAVIPAWALEVAAEVADTSVQALLGGEDDDRVTPDRWRQVEDAIGRLEREMIEVRQRVNLPWRDDESAATDDESSGAQARGFAT